MKILFIFLLCIFSLFIGQGLYFLRKGFSINHLRPEKQLLVNTTLDVETQQILKQPFRYLGRGRQCFAFESADQKYVLKCIRTDKFTPPFWTRLFPKMLSQKKEKIDEKKKLAFESFRIAKNELGEMTGTIALHLGKSNTHQKITIFDPLGIRHQLLLDDTLFILQHKRPLWASAFLKSNTQEKQQLLDTFVELVIQRTQKGILNIDPHFLPNYGFENGKTYQIDIGDFRRDPNCTYQKTLHDSLSPLQKWLAKTDPEMLEYLNIKISQLTF